MTPIAKLYALLESNGIYDEAISLLREYKDAKVVGATGDKISLSDLPKDVNVRWTPLLKAKLVHAVRGGLLSFEDAVSRYDLSPEEFGSWQRKYDEHNVSGLRSMKSQQYR